MTYCCPPTFGRPWYEGARVFFDFETTALPPEGRAVEVGLARFEREFHPDDPKKWRHVCTGTFSSFIDPGIPIPDEATAIHGITDEMVAGAPTVEAVFEMERVRELCANAQPAAFNGSFDRLYLPKTAPIDHSWPFLDTLTLSRKVDRYVSGKGKNKLGPTCERHGIVLGTAHRAGDDARAAGELFNALIAKQPWADNMSLGGLLKWMRDEQNTEWFRFHSWLYEKQSQESTP